MEVIWRSRVLLTIEDCMSPAECKRYIDVEDARGFSVKPVTDRAIVLNHRISHEGAEVIRGCKYALRTDVMYGRAL